MAEHWTEQWPIHYFGQELWADSECPECGIPYIQASPDCPRRYWDRHVREIAPEIHGDTMQITYRIDARINNEDWQEIANWTAEIDENTAGLPALNMHFMPQLMGALLGSNYVELRLTRIH